MTVQLFAHAVTTSLTKISTLEQRASGVLVCDWLLTWTEHAQSKLTQTDGTPHGLFAM